MTREEIIRLAREAGFAHSWSEAAGEALERFAAIVAAAERDAYEQDGNCKHCEDGCPACDARMIEVEQARVDALARSYESGYYAGVNAEREACAVLVERGMGDWLLGKKVANAIRARGQE